MREGINGHVAAEHAPLGTEHLHQRHYRFGRDASKYQRPREVARRPRGALATGSCSTYRFPPRERISVDVKENAQPLPDDFSITSSAMAGREGGTERPSILAVSALSVAQRLLWGLLHPSHPRLMLCIGTSY